MEQEAIVKEMKKFVTLSEKCDIFFKRKFDELRGENLKLRQEFRSLKNQHIALQFKHTRLFSDRDKFQKLYEITKEQLVAAHQRTDAMTTEAMKFAASTISTTFRVRLSGSSAELPPPRKQENLAASETSAVAMDVTSEVNADEVVNWDD